MKFTQDWFSHNIPNFEKAMAMLPSHQDFLEIGCFEGRASCWLLQHGLDPDGELTCIDTFQGSEEHVNLGLKNMYQTWANNTQEAKAPDQIVNVFVEKSNVGLSWCTIKDKTFDFIYVDASHAAPDVMTDACMAFPLLKKGGIMLFDDYLWGDVPGLLHRPKLAIDLFVTLFSEQCSICMLGYQLAVKKI